MADSVTQKHTCKHAHTCKEAKHTQKELYYITASEDSVVCGRSKRWKWEGWTRGAKCGHKQRRRHCKYLFSPTLIPDVLSPHLCAVLPWQRISSILRCFVNELKKTQIFMPLFLLVFVWICESLSPCPGFIHDLSRFNNNKRQTHKSLSLD